MKIGLLLIVFGVIAMALLFGFIATKITREVLQTRKDEEKQTKK